MSGGSMDYVFCKFREAADHVRSYLLDDVAKKSDDDFAFDAKKAGMNVFCLRTATHRFLEEAWMALHKAAIYAKRVEWLESGDDGFDNFISMVREELEENGLDPDPLDYEFRTFWEKQMAGNDDKKECDRK